MSRPGIYPRLAERPLVEALEDSPVVLIHGPRQCGKTTLARAVCEPRGYRYITFDDEVARVAAAGDPAGFADDLPARVVLDEVQLVPALFSAIKRAVDRDRAPGRFVLTGSTNVLLLPNLADSLAGRMEIIRLHPLAQVELRRTEPAFFDRLFEKGFPTDQRPRLGHELADRIVAGGYPAALARRTPARRSRWYRDYVQAIVERDVRDLARIHEFHSLPQLMSLAASQTAHLVNVTELSAPFQLSRQTIRDYVTLLERVFLVEEVPPWHSNRLGRLVKTPKLHVGDTGVAATLLGVDAAGLWSDRALFGQLLETFVLQELQRQATSQPHPLRFHHFRDKDATEVDIVVEQGPRAIAGVEVKAGATVSESDLRGLRKLRKAAGTAFRRGVVLYDGETTASLGERLSAVAIRSLWESDGN
ncbi:MAG: ATP-binding protein [Myxococcales bacterium]